MSNLIIANQKFSSRLFIGTGKFSSPEVLRESLDASESEMVTVALRRVDMQGHGDPMLTALRGFKGKLLPNTSGVRDAREAVFAAQMAREALETPWIKLEVHPDQRWLLPDPLETLRACEELAKDGFIVLPYVQADPVLCKRLEDAGAAAVMPLGAPIGTNQGLQTRAMLEIIIAQSRVPVVVDAGIGAPSHACEAMEMGASAVLVNTAIAVAGSPVTMAQCFRDAVRVGRAAYETGLPTRQAEAAASSPLTAFLENR
ncbi:MAG TPA: thiazole synthase [Fibrobacteraceae bacterium]|nr:thiazole synthase [Fibrobacteraceae bacterium]